MTEKNQWWRNHLISNVFYEYDSKWYNVFHFDKKWIHAITWNKYDEEWYDQYWYNKNWIDRNWFNHESKHEITKDYFDEYWLDEYGFDKNWRFSIPNPHYPNSPFISSASDTNIYWYERDLFCEFSSTWIHKLTKTKYNEYGVDWKWCDKDWEFIWNKKCYNIANQILMIKKDVDDCLVTIENNESKLNEHIGELGNFEKLKSREIKNEELKIKTLKEYGKEYDEYKDKYDTFIKTLNDFREKYYDNHKTRIDELRETDNQYNGYWLTYEDINRTENVNKMKNATPNQKETLKNESFLTYPSIKKVVLSMVDILSLDTASKLINLSYVIDPKYKIELTNTETDKFAEILKEWKILDFKKLKEIEEKIQEIEEEILNIESNIKDIEQKISNIKWKIQKLEWVIKNLKNKIKELKNESMELEWELRIEQNICKEKLNSLFEV